MCIKTSQKEIDGAFVFISALTAVINHSFNEVVERSDISVTEFNNNFYVALGLIVKCSH
ncbi:hypothetical protein MK852_19540 [Shewanella benthica]|nr:hypothetical protein [Shewanella benthica]